MVLSEEGISQSWSRTVAGVSDAPFLLSTLAPGRGREEESFVGLMDRDGQRQTDRQTDGRRIIEFMVLVYL